MSWTINQYWYLEILIHYFKLKLNYQTLQDKFEVKAVKGNNHKLVEKVKRIFKLGTNEKPTKINVYFI